MAGKSQLQRAIEKIDEEIAVLQAARARLVAEQEAQAKKKGSQ